MNIRRLLYFPYSDIVLSVLLGFGLATMFRISCKDNRCLRFVGPNLEELREKTFKMDGKCYKVTPHYSACAKDEHKGKKLVHFADTPDNIVH